MLANISTVTKLAVEPAGNLEPRKVGRHSQLRQVGQHPSSIVHRALSAGGADNRLSDQIERAGTSASCLFSREVLKVADLVKMLGSKLALRGSDRPVERRLDDA